MQELQRLEQIICKLRQLTSLNLLSGWYRQADLDASTEWQPVAIAQSSRGQDMLSFVQNETGIHLRQTWTVPHREPLSLQGATARLSSIWWADFAAVWVNGRKVLEGDLFDQKSRLLLGENLEVGQEFLLEIELNSPKHDRGALQKSEVLIEYPHKPCDPSKLADELAVIQAYLPILHTQSELERDLTEAIAQLETLLADEVSERSLTKLAKIRDSLLPIGKFLKQRKVYLLGNAHIDVAWLWAIAETKDVVKRTFASVLNLQKQYPELIFNQSTALSYAWMEREQPELFAQIQTAVQKRQWELTGGMWVEPDCNLPNGESLIRQILYGKNYFLEKFQTEIEIAWLPDTFGFNWQLPQILVKSGFSAFVTQKLMWNDTNKFPEQIFWWQGLDGSKIFTYFSNEIGLGIEPVAIAKFLSGQEQKHSIQDGLWLYGVGDHGGGPTADMLDLGREWSKSDLFFTVESGTAENFILSLKASIEASNANIPTWNDELYLEFHRGTYTTKADQKRQHRQTEILLGNAEKLCAIAAIVKAANYPKAQLDLAWQGLLLNQFHDILPGTSIPEVFEDADRTWAEVRDICNGLIAEAISCRMRTAASPPLSEPETTYQVWNLLNWSRSELVEIPVEIPKEFSSDRNPIENSYFIEPNNPSELIPTQQTEHGILFRATDIPSMGTYGFRLLQIQTPASVSVPSLNISEDSTAIYLENQYLKVTVDTESGEISQIFDKRYQHSLLRQPCELQFFSDRGQYWDAWNIDPEYESKQLSGLRVEGISIHERGEIRVTLRIVRRFGNSQFQQDIQLNAYDAYLTVKNWVDWQEEHTLVKVAFPVSWRSPFATYEIPMGAIERSTLGETAAAKAKFEVSAQFWADMSSEGIGLSVLNDCKYGYDAKPDQLRLTLLRSPNFPSPQSDRGQHEFIYRLVPHQGNWREAGIVQQGYGLNHPCLLTSALSQENFSFLRTSAANVILSAMKQSEDRSGWILRFYESYGQAVSTDIFLIPNLQITSIQECDLMENSICEVEKSGGGTHPEGNRFTANFQPYEIKTFKLLIARLI
ncbi:glycoside hydrolase family 38 C-terminal domain-containing protein [Tumidithrix elongata RA019]|uniref:Glycoside hydrolase family 38 C-terminal domain-containing protein n=1 Tax=Tumidithrix elongata BACA0141 TaxID=2716417 RepID=A0AAW9Q0P6_9CYAN|nr:glycoside hydrolase family 38 C-terminal domain-containing protein [Tumidithrix elongata RA019]